MHFRAGRTTGDGLRSMTRYPTSRIVRARSKPSPPSTHGSRGAVHAGFLGRTHDSLALTTRSCRGRSPRTVRNGTRLASARARSGRPAAIVVEPNCTSDRSGGSNRRRHPPRAVRPDRRSRLDAGRWSNAARSLGDHGKPYSVKALDRERRAFAGTGPVGHELENRPDAGAVMWAGRAERDVSRRPISRRSTSPVARADSRPTIHAPSPQKCEPTTRTGLRARLLDGHRGDRDKVVDFSSDRRR